MRSPLRTAPAAGKGHAESSRSSRARPAVELDLVLEDHSGRRMLLLLT